MNLHLTHILLLFLAAALCFGAAQNPVVVEEKEDESFIRVSPKGRTTADRSRHRPIRVDSIEEHHCKHSIPDKMKKKTVKAKDNK